jgi:type IV pilus assembly protein PilM
MVDWNKDVKLSDLFGRKAKDAEEASASMSEPVVPEPPAPHEVPVEIPSRPLPVVVPDPAEGVHPPVPAAELDLPVEPAEKVPFWKRELSFGGGKTVEPKEKKQPKQKAPKQPKEPKQKRPKAEKRPKAQQGPKQPFWKRELSFGGGGANSKSGKAAQAKRQKRVVGLKIGGSQLAAARVHNNGVPELVQVAREELEPGTIVGGELRDPELLAQALKEFFGKHKLPRQGVRLGIANNRIGVRIFEITGTHDPKQLENAIRFRAQEALPIPIEEAVLDYHVLDERTEEDGALTRRVLLVVAYRDLVDRYVAACKDAGIKLTGIDLEAFALLRALSEPDPESIAQGAALVVVSIGHDRSTFAVSDGRICEFTRVLDWGGAALNVAVARVLDVSPSEAEPFKRALSLTHSDTPEGMTPEQAETAREAVRKQLQAFARELVSSLQFYQNQPGSLGIGEIVITGGTAHLHGLAEELHQLIGVRVRVGDPLQRVKLGKRVGEAEQLGSFAIAIGLGIED